MLQLGSLDGTAKLRLDAGCDRQDPGCPFCAACTRNYSAADVGRRDVLPVGSASSVRIVAVYEPRSGAGRRQSLLGARGARGAAGAFSMRVVVVHRASWLVVLLLTLGTILGIPCVMWLSWAHAERIKARPLPPDFWRQRRRLCGCRHPRWAKPWVQVGLATGVYLVVVGLCWFLVVDGMQHDESLDTAAAWGGLAIAAAGGVLLVAAVVRALREDARHTCPACGTPASMWRPCGTRLAPSPGAGGELRARKGHTGCMRCVQCRRPVVADQWEAGPADRPYHRECFEARCRSICAAPDAATAFCDAEG